MWGIVIDFDDSFRRSNIMTRTSFPAHAFIGLSIGNKSQLFIPILGVPYYSVELVPTVIFYIIEDITTVPVHEPIKFTLKRSEAGHV